ncbi:MAG: hypothetical protein ACFFEJ_07885 [Candidatus Thorarchaeota archaeon]
MEYKQLLDVSNLIVASIARSITRMGLSGDLIIAQVATEMESDDIQKTIAHSGLEVTGTDVDSVLNSFNMQMTKLGAVQKIDIQKTSDTEVIIRLSDCGLIPATQLIRGNNPTLIPPCAWMALLSSSVEKNTENTSVISACQWKADSNTCEFTVLMEAK